MSSATEDAKLSATGTFGDSKSTSHPHPTIPDILANAFADVSMEEAKIELSENAVLSTGKAARMPPSFGNLPDLSIPGTIESETELSMLKKVSSPSSDALAPFLNDLNIPNSHETNEGPMADPAKHIFNPESSVGGKVLSVTSPDGDGPSLRKRSPPPLFEPFIPTSDDIKSKGSESHSQILQGSGPILVSSPDTVSSLEEPNESKVNPFVSPPQANSPPSSTKPGNAGPFVNGPEIAEQSRADQSFPDSSDNGPVVFNPFRNGPGSVSPHLQDESVPTPAAVNPFGNVPEDANPFTPNPSIPAPPGICSIGSTPFSSVQNNANPSLNTQSIPNPFGANSGDVNPFETASQGVNPFSPDHIVSDRFASEKDFSDPFAHPAAVRGESSENAAGVQNALLQHINVDSLKKNIEGISAVARDLFRNLTKGKSLIERMEDMGGDSIDDSPYSDGNKNTMQRSSFDNESGINRANPLADPFSSPLEKMEPLDKAKDGASFKGSDPFAVNHDAGPAYDIRKVTPIENPVMDMKPEYKIDANVSEDPFAPFDFETESELLHKTGDIMGVSADGEAVIADVATSSSATFASERTPVASGDAVKIDGKKINGLEDELSEFKENISGIDMQFDSIRGDVEHLSSKVSDIDSNFSSFVMSSEEAMLQSASKFSSLEEKVDSFNGKIGAFESVLGALQSDNLSIRSDLSRIEENISELVNSYTALLEQLHESVQGNESNLLRMDSMDLKLDGIGSRISTVEKSQDGMRSTSMEFSRSISTLVDGMGKLSSEFMDFRQQSEQKHVEIFERIDSVTEYVDNEMKKMGAKSYKGSGQNVHLSNIVKNSSNMKLCMEWLEFLMELVGRNNLPDILSYYEELGWLTEKVRMELLNYAEGIDFYMEKPDWKLTPDDHIKSIWFIESLAGMKVDKNRLSVIDRDIEKVRKGSEIYGI
ncbi:MAG: FlaD/FlaE family flagellar protein [Methanolobus sp.]|nr:FlaD/FlaE family flagellar protein [Methanolobus sp.]